ncbi:MAG TPA: diaminopimelate decarboxylase, partial [Roseiflexaceae bacterium]|nr:diaminopimelate decarboxylase [Roseiflexaceae bacterium]
AQHYPGQTRVQYAAKALLNTALAQLIASESLGLDVVSAGELAVARHAGGPAEQIHLHGNATPAAELMAAIDGGVGQIIIDNLDQLDLVIRLCANRPTPQAIALRLSPEIAADTHHHIQTGHATSKFGLPLHMLDTAAQRIRGAAGLQLVGLHAHLGSQIFATEPFEQAITVLLDSAHRLLHHYGLPIHEINPGGGLGVAYTAEQASPDLARYAARIGTTLAAGAHARGMPLPTLVVEPGRSIIARAGVALYTIIASKPLAPGSDATRYLHIDGGMGDNIRPALYGARYTALLANRAADTADELVHVAGRYCESGDVLLRSCMLPHAAVGDTLAVAAAGAYTLSMASNYNLVPRPAVLLLGAGRARLIQRRETYADLLVRDRLLYSEVQND